jgi:hypothetical protein
LSDIFLSYKHAQRQEARQLAAALAARGWTVWWDWNIPAGANWQAELDAQLAAAGCVVVLWSADSVQSEWVLYEAQFGLSKDKLIQVRLEPLQPPAAFAQLQGIDLFGWEYALPFHDGFDKLRVAIRDLLARRAPLAVRRSGQWLDTPSAAGDLLRRDSAAPAAPRARPSPVMLLPPAFADLLDRAGERSDIESTLSQRGGVSLAGASGSGKSALLYHLGNLDHTARFHDGVVYLAGATQGEADLAQAVHEAFYDVAPGSRPSAVEGRRNLADKTALLIVDDAALPPAALDALSAHAPNAVWVYASEQVSTSARRRPVALKGLPAEDALRLFERALWRPLKPEERADAARLVEAAQGHPARIEQAAGVAAAQGVAAALACAADLPQLGAEDADGRRVLAALACGGVVPLEAELCGAIAKVDNVNEVLARLVKQGLVQPVPPGFRLAAGLAPRIEATPEFTQCRERATDAYMQFAFEARGTPRRVARLAAPMTAQMAWAADNGRSDEALRLARTLDGPLADANRWDAWRDMLSRAHDIASKSGNPGAAGWAQHQLGTRALMLGNRPEARRLLAAARILRQQSGDLAGLKATNDNYRYLRWSRWAVLLALLGGAGLTTLAAIPAVKYIFRPVPMVTPGSVDFGTRDVRAAPSQQAIDIGNTGRGALDVIDTRVRGPNAQSFTVAASCNGVKIAPASSCRLAVQFKPDAVGPHSATVTISAREVKETLNVPLRGVGTSAPVVRLSAVAIDFGQVELGNTANRSVTLSNTGSAPLTVAATAIAGDNAFTLLRDGCKGKAVPPDAQCAIELRFTPREAVAKSARLVINDNAGGSPRGVTLTGAGHATPRIEIAPNNLAFGKQEIGTQSAVQRLRVRNTGNIAIDVKGATLQGNAAFRLQDNCANTKLAVGAACGIDVRFAPTAIEASSARITLAHGAGAPLNVDLSGNGYGQPRIEVAPAQIDFGVLKPGTRSRREKITITNTGTDTVVLQPSRIDGDNRFAITGNTCPEKLAPKMRCDLEVGATATGTDKLAARLTVSHNAGAPNSVALTAAIEAPVLPLEIVDFTAKPSRLQQPGEVLLCFNARNAEAAEIMPGAPQPTAPNGACVTRRIAATTTFRLTVKRAGMADQRREVTVAVEPKPTPAAQPAILRFDATPQQLAQPGATRLCFSAQNAEVALITPGDPQPASPHEGCVVRRIATTTTFTLTVRRQGSADQSRQLTVPVNAPPPTPQPVILRFEANPRQLTQPGVTNLCFSAQNAESAVIVPGEPQPASPNGGCVARQISATMTFTLTLRRAGAANQTRNAVVEVIRSNIPPVTTNPRDGAKPITKVTPDIAKPVQRIVGWCCNLGTVTQTTMPECPNGGKRYATKSEADSACALPVVR